MEALSYVQAAYALTGAPKFHAGLEQLRKWRYPAYMVRQMMTFPPETIATWDDELAFWCYYTLISYASEPELRSIYLRSLERSWEVLRMQQLPFYNFAYGAFTGNDCEAPQAVQHLRKWSVDLVNHNYHNSHRSDLIPPRGYVPYGGGSRAISPQESESKWGSRSALQYDGGENSRAVTPPIGWLEDYWLGRYYGFIEVPKAQSPEATILRARAAKPLGAAPYHGLGRSAGQREK